MKKVLLATTLAGIAGTASAQSIKIQADCYLGAEPVRSYSVIAEDRQTVEVQDKEIRQYREITAAARTDTGRVSGDPQYEKKTLDLGLSLKFTPVVLADGRILLDAAYSQMSLIEMKQERVNGVLTDTPRTRFTESSTQVILPASFGNYNPNDVLTPPYTLKHNDVRFVFSATKI